MIDSLVWQVVIVTIGGGGTLLSNAAGARGLSVFFLVPVGAAALTRLVLGAWMGLFRRAGKVVVAAVVG